MKFECIVRKWIGGLFSFEYKELILFLLKPHKVLSTDDRKPIFTLRLLETNDLVGLSRFRGQKLNRDVAALLKCMRIKHEYFVNSCDKEHVHGLKLKAFGARKVFVVYLDPNVMHVLSPVDFESFIIDFVANAKSNSPTEHHLVAIHVVVHAVFKLRHERLLVDEVEVNQFFGGNLDSYIAFDVKDGASHPQFMILFPRCLFGNFIRFLFEK